jgi:hypothetical protein
MKRYFNDFARKVDMQGYKSEVYNHIMPTTLTPKNKKTFCPQH